MKRRTFLGAVPAMLAGVASTAFGVSPVLAAEATPRLRSGKLSRQLAGADGATEFWGYNGQLPGPVLRYRKGERAIIDLENGLDQLSTVHWHGLRVPNPMDGVPFVTQAPVAPGQSFRYEFELPDSGTFWYHPHQKSFEQVGRGMYGAFIVDEERPIEVDRELLWVLGDFRIDLKTGAHAPFGAIVQHAQEGRLGNVVTINGVPAGAASVEAVRSGERVRWRLINAATARVFRLSLDGHEPWVVAYDGQGITPHRPRDNVIVLGPGMRVDLVLDLMAKPGSVYKLRDVSAGTVLTTLKYRDEAPLRTAPLGASMDLQRNSFAKPNLKKAGLHSIDFQGGDFGPPAIGAIDGKEISYHDMKSKFGLAWTVNSHVAAEDAHEHQPLLVLKKGNSYIISMTNKTAFDHPIHLHGHFFRVLSYNGEPARYEEWRDTVFMEPWSEIEIALVAREPGDWMFHCHVLEHAAAGMMGVIRIA